MALANYSRMKESIGSLRWYFGVVGVFLLYSTGLWQIFVTGTTTFETLMSGPVLLTLNYIISFVLGLAYLYFAFTLPAQLRAHRMSLLKWFVILSLGVEQVLTFGIVFTSESAPEIAGTFLGLLVTLAVGWYLLHNLKRLAN